jgi:hypothetical protein
MMYIRFPLSLRNVEDLLHERGIDICHETVRFWWNSFGPMFLAQDGGRGARAALCMEQWVRSGEGWTAVASPPACGGCMEQSAKRAFTKLPLTISIANGGKGPNTSIILTL